MPKKIILLLILAFLLAGCTNPFKKTEGSGQQETSEKGFSLKNALSLGKSVKCTYETGQGEMTTWVKGKKTRVEGWGFGMQGGNGGMINDGEWIYMWGDKPDSGMKYKISALEEVDNQEEKDWGGVEDWKDVEKWAESVEQKYKVDCKTTVVNDNKFTPPADIQFKNLTETFEKMQKWEESFDAENPQESLSEEKMKELEDLMKDFGGE